MGNLLLCEVRCLWLCCNLLFCSTKILSELWKLLLLHLESLLTFPGNSCVFNASVQDLQPWLCPQHPLPCPGCSWKVPLLRLSLLGEGGGDSWGPVDGVSCSCCQLWVYPVCALCLSSQFGSAFTPGPVKDTNGWKVWWSTHLYFLLPTLFSCAPRDLNVANVFALLSLGCTGPSPGWISWDDAAPKMLLDVKWQFKKWPCFAVGHSKVVRPETVFYKWSVLFWRELFTKEVEHCFY